MSAAPPRRAQLGVPQIARARLIGMALLCATIFIHNQFILAELSVRGFVALSGLLIGYALVASALLRWFTNRPALASVSDGLYVADIVLWTVAIHATGGDRSLLFFL